jgi:uncharacterized protein (DUF362 family)
MAKKSSNKFSRRDFLRISAGAAVAAGIGCGGKDPGAPAGSGAGVVASGTGGAVGNAGNIGPISSTQGGTTATATGGKTAAGGKAGSGAGGKVTGGTSASGGSLASGGASGSTTGAAGTGATGQPLVAMVRGTDWATATEKAIEMVGGLPDLTGKTVMLRPNVISRNPNPETTNPEVIRGVIKAAKAKGAAKIIVAEDGFANRTITTLDAMTTLKITEVCTAEGAEALDLRGRPTASQSPAGVTQYAGGINFYKDVLDADYVINLPVCKTHGNANFSMAIKGWFGCVPDRPHTGNLHYRLAELHLVRQEDFVVLDASKAMVTGGPQNGAAADSKIVVASRDPIATDVTGLCIIKKFGPALGGRGAAYNLGVWEQPQIMHAMELNFPGWLTSKQKFAYAQDGVTEHEEIMAFRDA